MSTGQQAMWIVKQPFRGVDFARLVERKLGPFMAAAFPDLSKRVLLLDGEKLMHTPEATAALREAGISVLPNWPAYSPDLNPQENVWPWLETKLRESEKETDDFSKFVPFFLGNGAGDVVFRDRVNSAGPCTQVEAACRFAGPNF